MDQIEVNIKVAASNYEYNLPIRKSDTILKLKEYCEAISSIPPAQQNLLFKGKKLLNEKLISDYNIENNGNILLVKKDEPKPENNPINQNPNNLNLNGNLFNINNINLSNNNELNSNEIADAYKRAQFQDLLSLYDNIDINKIDSFYKLMGINLSDICGMDLQQFKELLKDPSNRDMLNSAMNMFRSFHT